MARSKSKYPTELELEILKILWQEGELSVREVREFLTAGGRELAHTTLITMLNIMTGKKYVSRKAKANSYLFRPKVTQERISQGMASDLVTRVFGGSPSALMLSLLDHEKLSPDEREQLLDLVKKHRNSQS
ncbi:MAG: BlaI/MecI/CopY family transcriptional regulator [Akkermansiaceae bacterium]|jgi:BlaI family penicillinase repressor